MCICPCLQCKIRRPYNSLCLTLAPASSRLGQQPGPSKAKPAHRESTGPSTAGPSKEKPPKPPLVAIPGDDIDDMHDAGVLRYIHPTDQNQSRDVLASVDMLREATADVYKLWLNVARILKREGGKE